MGIRHLRVCGSGHQRKYRLPFECHSNTKIKRCKSFALLLSNHQRKLPLFVLRTKYEYFKELTSYLVADSYFAKSEVVQAVTSLGMHFTSYFVRSTSISRLRDDAVLYYLNREPKTGKRGAPKKYAGRVNPNEPNMNFCTLIYSTNELNVYLYCVRSTSIMQLFTAKPLEVILTCPLLFFTKMEKN